MLSFQQAPMEIVSFRFYYFVIPAKMIKFARNGIQNQQ